MGRVPHLLVMDVATGRVRDLFEGTPYELMRSDPDRNAFDISPDGRRIVFAFDHAAEKLAGNCFALAEIELKGARVRELARDAAWDMGAPRYSPDGERIAFLASHQGQKHTMPAQLCVWDRESGRWTVESGEWDHEVHRPAAVGGGRPVAALHAPSRRAASTCGASTCPTGAPSWWSAAARSAASTSAPARW